MGKILVYHDFSDELKTRLSERFKEFSFVFCKKKDEVLNNIEDAEIFISFRCNLEMLEKAKNLKWIQILTAGVDGLPVDYIKEKGLILTNGRGAHRVHMSEYAIGAMISLARNIHIMYQNQQKGKWERHVPQGEIYDATVGILGLGSIGQEIAKKATLLGMHVIGVKGTPEKLDYVEKVYGEDEMDKVFKESDYIINLLPHTSKTDKVIDKSFFNMMKETACFINMGRGGTVNEEDLIDALLNNKIRALVSDVFNKEPLPEDSPFWKMGNVIITPHICGVSAKYDERSMDIIEHNIEAYMDGGKMVNIVDFQKGY